MFQRAVIAICSIAFLLFGLAFAFFPREITTLVTGGHISPVAATDVRAIYGGMSLGIAFSSICAGVAGRKCSVSAYLLAHGPSG